MRLFALYTGGKDSTLAIIKALKNAQQLLSNGIKDASVIIDKTTGFIKSYERTSIDYISICDPETLEDIKTIDRKALMAIAVNVGDTRLIDNMIINP